MRSSLLERLNAVPGIDLQKDSTERRPSFPMQVLSTGAGLTALQSVLTWFVEAIGHMTPDDGPAPAQLL